MDPKEVSSEEHTEFYRFVGNTYDTPRFILHYKTDAPLSIRAVLYFPEGKPGLFEMSRDADAGVALYSRKILIKSKTDNILPKWLRFVKGNRKFYRIIIINLIYFSNCSIYNRSFNMN